ncbi:MAG: AIM24 family protein [Verrucomicrobiales bacterium]|nr:AIM24 family protein [Verrucomicrobiales bacterium]
MSRYSLQEFVNQTAQQDLNQGVFELESDRMLEVNLNGLIWMKMGAMVSYRGQVKFTREGILEQGLSNLLKKAVSGEGTKLTKAEGRGKMYLADLGKKISIIQLSGESLCVNGNDILAFEPTVKNDIKMMRRVAGMMAGGLFNYQLSGHGLIAITSHYNPMTLRVTPGNPVFTDPNATIAWSASLSPSFKTDISFKTLLGRSSGETFQMQFEGDGFVVVQPYEEVYLAATR